MKWLIIIPLFPIVIMDGLTHGGLFKGAWWQEFRKIWMGESK